MTQKLSTILLGGALAAVLILGGALFTVDQTKQAIVLRFGELQKVHDTPGLKIKIPFIEEVLFYEKRVLNFDLPEVRITTGDQKRMIVDTYTRYRINDPVMFFRAIKPATEQGAAIRLEALISSTVRNVLGKVTLRNLLSQEREKIMKQIEEEVGNLVKPLGLEIIDVRIIRTELPPENRNAVFARMNAELVRIAKENRAVGAEKAQEIISRADKDKVIILAEAQKKAQDVRGKGDAKAIEIASAAFGKDIHFYEFYKTMETYRNTLDTGTTMVLTTDTDLFRFFDHSDVKSKG
jgi:membrane protease subunit HflC